MRILSGQLLYSDANEVCRDGTIIDSTEAIVKHWGRYVFFSFSIMHRISDFSLDLGFELRQMKDRSWL